jgi:hypothetical protein
LGQDNTVLSFSSSTKISFYQTSFFAITILFKLFFTIMKFIPATTALLLLRAFVSTVDANQRRTEWHNHHPKDPTERMLQKQGKKGGGKNGGNRKDCTDGATVISTCEFEINQSGRYVLNSDLNCEQFLFGINLRADDVHLDCQGHQIQGTPGLTFFGIRIFDSEHVTVSSCKASNCFEGLRVGAISRRRATLMEQDSIFNNNNIEALTLTDIIVRDSIFNNNAESGMTILGDSRMPGVFTVVNSTFNENGNFGVSATNVIATFYSCTMNNNKGTFGGFFARGSGASTLIDITANGNIGIGIVSGVDAPAINVINSIACGNGSPDMKGVTIAQANTCTTSDPMSIGVSSVCQCRCPNTATATTTAIAASTDGAGNNNKSFVDTNVTTLLVEDVLP